MLSRRQRQGLLPAIDIVRIKEGDRLLVHRRQLTLRFAHHRLVERVAVEQHRQVLFRQILPERVLPAEHERHAKLNQQTQGAYPLLAIENEITQIAGAQDVEVVLKRHLLREQLQVFSPNSGNPAARTCSM